MASAPARDDKSGAKRVAVVGAGVSGLAAAYKLSLRGLNVTIFEAEERAGGKLKSVSQDGLVWDEGANTMTEAEGDVSYLLDNLRLREKQQFPISQNKRYIVRDGTPVLLPSNPIALIKSNILSTQSKVQMLLEPFLWKKKKDSEILETHESVGGFFRRHFGQEVVDYLIDPFVAGVNAGDPESLSMVHAFPELWNLEKSFGSIIVGAFRSKISAKKVEGGGMNASSKSKRRTRGSFSFLGGMQDFLASSDIGYALTQPEAVSGTQVLEFWRSGVYDDGGAQGSPSIIFSSGEDEYVVTLSTVQQALQLPENCVYSTVDEPVLQNMMASLGYERTLAKLGQLKRSFIRREWTFFFDCIIKAFANKCSNFDAIPIFSQQIG